MRKPIHQQKNFKKTNIASKALLNTKDNVRKKKLLKSGSGYDHRLLGSEDDIKIFDC